MPYDTFYGFTRMQINCTKYMLFQSFQIQFPGEKEHKKLGNGDVEIKSWTCTVADI